MDLTNLTIKKVHEGFKNGDFTVKELVDAYISEIKSKNDDINAYLEVFSDLDEQSSAAQKKIRRWHSRTSHRNSHRRQRQHHDKR